MKTWKLSNVVHLIVGLIMYELLVRKRGYSFSMFTNPSKTFFLNKCWMWDFGFSETQWYLDGQNIQKKTSWTHGNGMFLFIFEELSSVLQISISMNKLLILMFLLNYLFIKATLFATKREELSHQCQGNESFHWCQLHQSCKLIASHKNLL